MAYQVPPRWSHGDFPTAADMNKYKDALDDIFARVGSSNLNRTVSFREGNIQSFFIVHQYRWLLYRGDGWIQDPSGIGERASLSVGSPSSQWLTFDLMQIDWMTPGKLYQIQNVDSCFEDFEAL